jgi:hypothetical protein
VSVCGVIISATHSLFLFVILCTICMRVYSSFFHAQKLYPDTTDTTDTVISLVCVCVRTLLQCGV